MDPAISRPAVWLTTPPARTRRTIDLRQPISRPLAVLLRVLAITVIVGLTFERLADAQSQRDTFNEEDSMFKNSRRRAIAVAVIAVALTVSFASHPLAGPGRNGSIRNVVLVHGAWADGSSWSRVIPLLQARGFNVAAAQLPLTSLADDVAAVKRAIDRMASAHSGPVVLVGHSYGGAVIGEAGNDPRVAALVYVAAFAPDQGESALGLLSAYPTAAPLGDHLSVDPSGFFTIDSAGVEDDFAQCLSSNEREILAATQGPTSIASLAGTSIAPAWKAKPSWYIIASRDRSIPPGLEESMATRMHALTTTLRTCHVAMLDEPFKVTDVILDAAGAR